MTPPPTPSDADLILANWRIIWYIIGGILFVMTVAIAFLIRSIKKNLPIFQQFKQMIEDFNGTPAVTKPGPDGEVTTTPLIPGMVVRMKLAEDAQKKQVKAMVGQNESLARLESVQETHGEQLKSVHHELNTNHGSSVKDALKRTEGDVVTMRTDLTDVQTDVKEVRAGLDTLTDLISSKVKPLLSIETTVNHNEVRPVDGIIVED